jgi:predicted RNA-binding Zn-ribbon protein involved in translation (DUF1610 family)
MTACMHDKLEVLPRVKERLRCTRCHLTISREEIGDGHCPECYEETGMRHREFEEVEEAGEEKARFRCEDCGAIIEWQGPC